MPTTRSQKDSSDSGDVPGSATGSELWPVEVRQEEERREKEAFEERMNEMRRRLEDRKARHEQELRLLKELHALELKCDSEKKEQEELLKQERSRLHSHSHQQDSEQKGTLQESDNYQATLEFGEMDASAKTERTIVPAVHGSGQSVSSITKEQLATRKAISTNLPKFAGEAEIWPLFISSYTHTTEACGFTNLENLKRLQDCLHGEALEAVRGRLLLPQSVPNVIEDLKSLYGSPKSSIAQRLNVSGVLEPLVISWTNDINRHENESRLLQLMISEQGSNLRYNLFNGRTLSELKLPAPTVQIADMKRNHAHLENVPAKEYLPQRPMIILGLDNVHLFAPIESHLGNVGEPIAVRSSLGWSKFGSEKSPGFVANCIKKSKGEPIETLRATVDQRKVLLTDTLVTKRTPLQQHEYAKAEMVLIRTAQAERFIDELKTLMKNKEMPSNQWIGLERSSMEGRTERAESLPYNMRFPIILPSDHYITGLIIKHYHERCGHGYRETVKNELRQQYYIPHLDACSGCKLHVVQSSSQPTENTEDGTSTFSTFDAQHATVQLHRRGLYRAV
uniref:Integrase zinc-binding domain-containing protein n=1 Tax=Anopheles minimus TaxID=112268 RepID=A0A182WAB1_9DIPT